MKKKNSLIERILSLTLSVAIVFTMIPTTAFATVGDSIPTVGDSVPTVGDSIPPVGDSVPPVTSTAVECHIEHDTACGYIEAVEGTPAIEGVPCDKACKDLHVEDCAYKEAVEEIPAIIGAECTHKCENCESEDSGTTDDLLQQDKPVNENETKALTSQIGTVTKVNDEAGLRLAVSNAIGGETLKLMATFDLENNALEIPVTMIGALTIDLNGKELISRELYAIDCSKSKGTLIITDSSGGEGVLVNKSYSKKTIYLAGESSLIVEGGQIISEQGTAIHHESSGTISITGGIVKATQNAIYHNSTGTLSITGGTVECTSGGYSAIYTDSTGAVIISGDAIVAGNEPATIECMSVKKITISGHAHVSGSTYNLDNGTILIRAVATTGDKVAVEILESGYLLGEAYNGGIALNFLVEGVTRENVKDYYYVESSSGIAGRILPSPLVGITFSTRCGPDIDSIIDNDGTINFPNDVPEFNGYTLEGWYKGIDGTGEKVTADTTFIDGDRVYAKWMKDGKTVRTRTLDFKNEISYMSTDGTTKTVDPSSTSITDNTEGWAWDLSTKTLTLDGAEIITEIDHGINMPSNDVTIVLKGENNVTTKAVGKVGVYSEYISITINGEGSLNAKGDGTGIESDKALNINDATVTAESISMESNMKGIQANSININNATVTAIGSDFGMSASSLAIKDSVVTAKLRATGNIGSAMSIVNGINIDNSTVTAIGIAYGISTAGSNPLIIKDSVLTVSGADAAIFTYNSNIVAEDASVTGANEEFISGTTKKLTQADPNTPVVISFGPNISVGAQTEAVTYGAVASPTFAITSSNFGGVKYPAFVPSIEWTTGTAPAGVTATFSADNGTLTIKTSATTPAGEHKFKIVSPKTSSIDGNYESGEASLTVERANSTVEVEITKKPTTRAVIGDRDDTFTIKATVTGVNGEKPTGTVLLKNAIETLASAITVTNGVATYEWVKPAVATYTITADFTATPTGNYKDATVTSDEFDISKAVQAELKFKDVPTTVTKEDVKIDFATEGGSGIGLVTYQSSDTAIIGHDGVVGGLGKATITATKAGDTDYNEKTATIEITVATVTPYFNGNDLFAVGEPILLINENNIMNAYWDKNGDGLKNDGDTIIAKSTTTGEPTEWNIYGGSKVAAMTATDDSQIILYSAGFKSINAGSKVGGDATAGTDVKRTLRIATTEDYGTPTGFNLTQYKMTFDVQGSSYATSHIWQAYNESLGEASLTPPTKAGHTFMGFYDAVIGGTQYYREDTKKAIPIFTEKRPVTLYAKWSEGSGIFAGRYSHYQVFDCAREPAYPQNNESFRVFNFATPFDDTEGSGYQMSKAEVENKIFYFKKSGNTGNPFILYMADDVDGTNGRPVSRNGNIHALGKEGLLFISQGSDKGYFISLSQGFDYGDEVTYSPTDSGPITLDKANNHPDASPTPWDPTASYAVTFNSQGANTLAMPSQISVRKTPSPSLMGILPSSPVKEGYLFKGWWTGANGTGTEILISTELTGNISAYAKWEGNIEPLSVTLNGANLKPSQGTGIRQGVKNATWTDVVLPNPGYKLPDTIEVTVGGVKLTDGYTYTSATGEITISKEKMTANVVIDIIASPITYKVKYHANGATGEPSITEQTITFGTTVNAADIGSMSTKPNNNWTFLGWARTGDAVTAEYASGAEINTINPVTLTDGATVSLYAIWNAQNAKISIQNGSFEKPIVRSRNSWTNFKNGDVGLEWKTTAKDGKHEIIRPIINVNSTNSAFNTRTASEGEQFAELNANGVGALYQEVQTIPGSILHWGADHRGRSGIDTMQIWIGVPTDITTALNQYVKGGNKVSAVDPTLLAKIKQMECKSDNKAWENYEGSYTVPTEQEITTFAFVSVASANGSVSYGNLLDNIYFSFVKPARRQSILVRTTTGGTVTVSDGSKTSTVIDANDKEYAGSLEHGNVLRLGVQPKDGYSFNGGYINGKLYHTKNAFLTASNNMKWTVDENTPSDITILFSKNSTVVFASQGGVYGKAQAILTADGADETLATPTKKDHKFGGWLIAGSSTILKENDTIAYVTNPKTGAVKLEVSTDGKKLDYAVDDGIILIAQWTYDDSYLKEVTVKLDYDDGITSSIEQKLDSANTQYTLPTPPANTQKRFTGWRYPMGDAHIEGKDKLYQGSTVVRFDQNGSNPRVYIGGDINIALEEILLIAQWEPRQATSVVIKENPKTSYEYSDSFDPTGLVVTVTYDNGVTADVPYTGNEDKFAFTPSVTDKLIIANDKVTITYTENDKANQLELPIIVVAKKLTPTGATVSNKEYDGNTTVTNGIITLTGISAGDVVTVSGNVVFADKNAGTNKNVNVTGITISGKDAGNYILTDTSLMGTATTAEITKKPVSITWNGTTARTYDGQKSGVYASATGALANDVCNVIVTDGDKIDAGDHNATATLTNTNYTISGSDTTSYTINKAGLNATYEGATVIYKDKVPSAALKVSVSGFVNGENATTAHGYIAPTMAAVDWSTLTVGTHSLPPSGGTATNYTFNNIAGNLNVLAKDFDAVIIQDYIGDYDGTAHKLDIINVDGAAVNLVITYYPTLADATAGTNGTTTAPERTDAGTTTVYFKVSADGYSSQTGTGTITINKKSVTAVIDAQASKVYDGNTTATGVTLKLNGVIPTDDAVVKGTILFTNKDVGTDKTVVVSGISIDGAKKDNYTLTSTSLTTKTTAGITAKPITLDWSGTNLTYTGTSQNVTATIPTGGVASGDNCVATVTGGTAKNYQASAYTATASISNENYSLTNPTHTYSIGKAKLNAKFKDQEIRFGGTPALVVEVKGFVGGETASTALGYTVPIIQTSPIPTAVSSTPYEIELSGGTANNYDFDFTEKGTLTITKADMASSVIANGYTGEYDGIAHGITVTAPAGATFTYTDNQTIPSTSNAYTNAGTYIVNYTVTHANYATVTGNATVQINKKVLVPTLDTATVQNKVYDKTGLATVTGTPITLSGLVGIETMTTTQAVSFIDVNVGGNKAVNVSNITLTGLGNGNYVLSTAQLSNIATTAEITPLTVSFAWAPTPDPIKFTYDGTAKSVTATVSNLIAGDNCNVVLEKATETIPGSYIAKAISLTNTNYMLPISGLTKSFEIEKATITGITATPTIKNYDGVYSDGVKVTGQRPTDDIFYSIDNGTTWNKNIIPQVGNEGSTTDILVKVEREHYNTIILEKVTAIVKETPKVRIDKPIFDTTDVKKVTVGGIVTEGASPLVSQAFEIRKAGEASFTALSAGTTVSKDTTYKETLTNLIEDTQYELRLTATDDQGVTASTTLSFRTQPKTPPTGGITGEVEGDTGPKTIIVTLELGNTVVASITGLSTGDMFSFSQLPDGEYNVVATDIDNKRVTMMATVKEGKTTNLGTMKIGKEQSAVKVEGKAPPIAVGGLHDIFATDTYLNDPVAPVVVAGGGTVEIRLTANEAKAQNEVDDIKAGIGSDTVSLLVDLKVDMIITPNGTPSTVKNLLEVDELLTVAIPLPADAIGKTTYKMYRHHVGSVQTLTQIQDEASKAEGTFRIEGKYAYVYASKFSTYAITYAKPTGGGSGGGGGGGSYYNYHYINLNAGEGGSFIPKTSRYKIREGHTIGIDIVPNAGYEIEDVIVNGTSVGAVKSYFVRNIREDYDISASFRKTTQPPANAGGGNAGNTGNAENPSTTYPTNPNPNTSSSTPLAPSTGDNPSDDVVVDYNPDSLIKELEKKRDETIANLPNTLSEEERKSAIDEINRIYDETSITILSAKNTFEGSDLLNKAVSGFENILTIYDAMLPSTAPSGKKPFVLASALLALVSIIFAVLAVLKRKKKEHKNRKRLIILAIGGAVGSIITFLLTTGWSGLVFANTWTLLVLVFTILTAYGAMKASSENNQ